MGLFIFIMTVWILMFTLALSRVRSINVRSFRQVAPFFFVAPILNLVVLIGWGILGLMSEDWEDLM